MKAPFIQALLSSKKLKIKPKDRNITGLQLADLIAHPSALYVRQRLNGESFRNTFGNRIVEILVESKYHRDNSGLIVGRGIKFLP